MQPLKITRRLNNEDLRNRRERRLSEVYDRLSLEPIIEQQTECHLDLTNTIMEVDVWNIDVMPNEEYAMLRKDGLGASDSSIVLGVNPYKTIQELIEEKSRDHLTEEEKAVGNESAVKKDLI